jgi:hypothetical protein
MKYLTQAMAVLSVTALMLITVLATAVEIPRPEHPRPDLQRENWLSLNGEWIPRDELNRSHQPSIFGRLPTNEGFKRCVLC